MNPIEDITREHGPIKLVLRVLEKINEKVIKGETLPTEDLRSAIEFIREFADKCHHGKEEALLFPAMKQNGIAEEGALIDVLNKEHIEGRGYVKKMAEAVEKKEINIEEFAKLFVDSAKKYIILLDQHIEKENMILFPKARHSLSDDQLKELEKGFLHVEENIIGRGRHEELHQIISKLRKAYL